MLGPVEGYVHALQGFPDGRIAVGHTNTISVFKDGNVSYKLEGHTGFVTCLALLPDGRLVSGSEDKTMRIWKDRKCVSTVTDHKGLVVLGRLQVQGRNLQLMAEVGGGHRQGPVEAPHPVVCR